MTLSVATVAFQPFSPVVYANIAARTGALDPESGWLTQYSNLMRDIHIQLHGIEIDQLGAYFKLDSVPTSLNTITGFSHYGDITIDIASCYTFTSDDQPDLGNISVSMVEVELIGPNGSDYVRAMVLYGDDGKTATDPILLPIARMSASEYHRVKDIESVITSTPPSILTGNPDGMRERTSDVSVCTGFPIGSPDQCICLAQASYDACVANAKANLLLCTATCTAATLAALAWCAPQGAIPVIGWFTATSCATAALIGGIICNEGCMIGYFIAKDSRDTNFEIALVPCGVVIAQQ
jgi:hypothetical protein